MGITQSNSTDLLKIFANDQKMILYRPEWRSFTGSVTATILLQQILYRWDKNGRKPFYKFKEPCGHDLYREGDSWTEELGFSRKEFDGALKKIATKRTKKTEGSTTTLVEYWTDINRITFYTINPDVLQTELYKLYPATPEPGFTKSPKGNLQVKSKRGFTKITNEDLEYKQRLTYKDKNDVRRNSVKSPPAPEKQQTEPSSPSPFSSNDFLKLMETLLAMVPEAFRKPSVSKVIKRALTDHSEDYVRTAIAYTVANSNGGTWQKFKAYLGQTIDKGWAEGWEPDNNQGDFLDLKAKKEAFLISRREMPTEHLKADAQNGCKTSRQVLKERNVSWGFLPNPPKSPVGILPSI